MSLECSICERDARGPHDPSCPRATDQPSTAPTTEAGRALLTDIVQGTSAITDEDDIEEWARDAILAIEAEARAAADAYWSQFDPHALLTARDTLLAQNEALRAALVEVVWQADYWAGPPRPATDGGTVRLHRFSEIQPDMERALDNARALLAQSPDTSALARIRDYDKDDALLLARANIKALHSEADELLALITELAAYGASVPEYDPSLTLVPKALTDRARSLLRTNSDTSDGTT